MSCGLSPLFCATPTSDKNHQEAGHEHDASQPKLDFSGLTLSLREALESAIITYKVFQSVNLLNPVGIAGDNATIRLQPDSASERGLLTALTIDTMPGMLSIASASNAFNLATFGVPNVTDSLKLTHGWLNRNILPVNSVILIARAFASQIIFSNRAHYSVQLDVTFTLGILDPIKASKAVLDHQGQLLS